MLNFLIRINTIFWVLFWATKFGPSLASRNMIGIAMSVLMIAFNLSADHFLRSIGNKSELPSVEKAKRTADA